MSTRNQLTKDLNESVKALLGKHVKILLKTVVKLETKADKMENRVLVFSPCRLFLLTAKVPTRIDTHCHYLEIQAIESKKSNHMSLTVGEKVYSFITVDETGGQDVDAMIQALYTAIHNIFPTVPLSYIIRRIDVLPESRVQYLEEQERYSSEVRGIGPCGGFSTQYACMCDYHALPYREEVAWDVDTIYLSHDTRELCLRDFDHLDPKDLVPIISALEYNTWFTKLRTSHIKLTHEAVERLLHVMKKSLSVEELYLDNLGFKWDFAHKLSLALIANGNTVLHTVDLSNNLIEDKGASSFCGFIAKVNQGSSHVKSPISRIPKGLIHLNLSHCGLTSKGVNHVAHALSLNKCMPNTLTHLYLNGNNLKDDVTNLCNFLAQPNVISHLDISKTDCSLETIFGALLRGCATSLVHLNVSHNAFNTKKIKELPPSFKQFFTSSISLKYVNMSYCKLPLDALKNLLLGLACNETIADVTLDISCNNLGPQGAHVLESCIHGVRSLSTLDITENNMDVELGSVLTAISKNKSLKHLHMGRNIVNIKTKHVTTIMESLVQTIQEEECVLQTLSIQDCKLKSDLHNLVNALGGNTSLTTLDISGNFMGDSGARLLAKALQVNANLKSIHYDKNNISLQGYMDLAYALESNFTLHYMPVPIYDIVPCMKISAERTEAVMKKIQDILHRNVSPKRGTNGHAFRLQQGFMLSSTQQMVDKLVAQAQETLKTISLDANHNKCGMEKASRIIRDAENSKHLLSYLHDVILKNERNGNPVDAKLRRISEDLHSTVVNHLQTMTETIIKAAEEECQTVFEKDEFQNGVRSQARKKNNLDPEFVHSCIVDQAGTQVMNRINDLNLAVASYISDKVTEGVMESLSECNKLLMGGSNRKRSSTPDVLRSMSRLSSGSSQSHMGSSDSHNQTCRDRSPILEYLNLATPHLPSKRASYHGRKVRPKSVVDCVQGISVGDIPDLLPSLQSSTEESLDSVSELPKSVNQQLQHLGKNRPKRAKTRAPTRSHLRAQDENDDAGTLDTFFQPGSTTPSTTTPLISPNSDDSISSILTDVTPNPASPNTTDYDRRNGNAGYKANHNSLPKKSHLEYVEDVNSSRSRSSDNLSKFSNSVSPLVRRIANFETNHGEQSSKAESDKSNRSSKIIADIRRISETDSESDKIESKVITSKPPLNVDLVQTTNKSFSKLPVIQRDGKDIPDAEDSSGLKPRRWSMVDNGNKNVNENNDNGNSVICGATIPVADISQEPDNPPEKKSVRELAASLYKQTKESPDNQRKSDSGSIFSRTRSNLMPTPFIQKSPIRDNLASSSPNRAHNSPGSKESS